MAIELHFSSISVGASVDQQTGNLSVFDVVEEVRTPQLPVQLQSVVLSLVWKNFQKEEFKGKIVIHLMTPDGNSQMVGTGDLNIKNEQKRVKAVLRFGGFPMKDEGLHRFNVAWIDENDQKHGETDLEFEVIRVAQVAQGVPPSNKPTITH